MGIRLKRLPEHNLNLNLYSGVVSADQLLRHICDLDSAANWLSYFDATADLDEIDLAHFPALKHAVAAKEDERGGAPARHALVNIPAANELFVRFWCEYAMIGVRNPHDRIVLPTIEATCSWLGLSAEGCRTVAAEIERAEARSAKPALAAALHGLKALRESPGPAAGGRPAGS